MHISVVPSLNIVVLFYFKHHAEHCKMMSILNVGSISSVTTQIALCIMFVKHAKRPNLLYDIFSLAVDLQYLLLNKFFIQTKFIFKRSTQFRDFRILVFN